MSIEMLISVAFGACFLDKQDVNMMFEMELGTFLPYVFDACGWTPDIIERRVLYPVSESQSCGFRSFVLRW